MVNNAGAVYNIGQSYCGSLNAIESNYTMKDGIASHMAYISSVLTCWNVRCSLQKFSKTARDVFLVKSCCRCCCMIMYVTRGNKMKLKHFEQICLNTTVAPNWCDHLELAHGTVVVKLSNTLPVLNTTMKIYFWNCTTGSQLLYTWVAGHKQRTSLHFFHKQYVHADVRLL